MDLDLWKLLIIDPMLNILLLLYTLLFNNFALTILVFTLLVRAITFPLTYQQQKSSKKMMELQQSPEWKKMQEKYAKDPQKLNQEQMRLWQQAGVNPLSGCLPTVIQLPVLMGLYQSINLAMAASPLQLLDLARHLYPFMNNVAGLIPLENKFLWLNLGLPDPFWVLPIVVGATTWLQSKVMTPATTSTDPQAAQMTQTMTLMMPVMFGYMSLSFPAGLSVYFIIANVIGIAQYAITTPVNWKEIFTFRFSLDPEPAKRK